MKPDTRKFIKKELRKGMKPYSIKKALVSQGYDQITVEEDIKAVRKETKIIRYLVIAIIILIVILLLLLYSPESSDGPDGKPINAEDYSDDELLNLAALHKDDAYCEYISAESLRVNCEALANRDTQEPTELEKRDSEYLNQAILEKNPQLCELIVYEATRDNCERVAQPQPKTEPNPEEELLNQAILEKDPLICAQIETESLKASCERLAS
ncbi:MAG: hypothetical protein ABIE94_05115 [archaeon]